VEPLIDTLWDDDARVRAKAAWALGMLGDPRALVPLQKLYRIEREDARETIQEAMEMIKQGMAGDLK
jgi:HEAT repeat protein